MISVMKRVIRQVAGDKRSLVMIIFAPLLILTLLYFLLGDIDYTPTIAVNKTSLSQPLFTALQKQDAHIINVDASIDPEQYLKEHSDTDAVFAFSKAGTSIFMYEASTKSARAMKAIQNAIIAINPSAKMNTSYVIGKVNTSYFENIGYIFFGLFSFFLIFLISGMSLVKERSAGTLERFLMSPIPRRNVIIGYTAGYGVFAILQAIVMTLYGVYVLGISCKGNILWAILIMLLIAVSAVSFGALVSVFSNSELQVVQMMPIAIIPQVFFSGLISLDTIPYGLGNLGYLTPVFYGCAAMKKVMVVGGGFNEIWKYVLGLVVYILLLSILNTLALKKYRKL